MADNGCTCPKVIASYQSQPTIQNCCTCPKEATGLYQSQPTNQPLPGTRSPQTPPNLSPQAQVPARWSPQISPNRSQLQAQMPINRGLQPQIQTPPNYPLQSQPPGPHMSPIRTLQPQPPDRWGPQTPPNRAPQLQPQPQQGPPQILNRSPRPQPQLQLRSPPVEQRGPPMSPQSPLPHGVPHGGASINIANHNMAGRNNSVERADPRSFPGVPMPSTYTAPKVISGPPTQPSDSTSEKSKQKPQRASGPCKCSKSKMFDSSQQTIYHCGCQGKSHVSQSTSPIRECSALKRTVFTDPPVNMFTSTPKKKNQATFMKTDISTIVDTSEMLHVSGFVSLSGGTTSQSTTVDTCDSSCAEETNKISPPQYVPNRPTSGGDQPLVGLQGMFEELKKKAKASKRSPSESSKKKVSCKSNKVNLSKVDRDKAILRDISRKSIKCLNPDDIMKLVEKENEDVETFATIANLNLHFSPGTFAPKKKLQKLRLNSESMALLFHNVIYPSPSADEALMEPTPEMMAHIMHLVERDIVPQIGTKEIFNSLFDNDKFDDLTTMSPVTHGPLQDVVIPLKENREIHRETITHEIRHVVKTMMKLFKDRDDGPKDDTFTSVMDDERKQPPKGKLKKEFKLQEDGPWGEEDIEPVVSLVGAEPIEVLDISDVDALKAGGDLRKDLEKGMEYFIETNQLQTVSRIQFRGTQPPSWFPGYIVALPQYEDLVQLAKSPSEVLSRAWKASHPQYFDDKSIITST